MASTVPPPTINPSEEVPIQKMPVEILEMTLDLLPFPDLVACMKACRQFRDAIAASKLLSRTLECEEIVTQEREGCGHGEAAASSDEPYRCTRCTTGRQFPTALPPSTDATTRKLCPLLSNATVEDQQTLSLFRSLAAGKPISDDIHFSAAEYFQDVRTWAPVYLTSPPVHAARLRLKFKLVCCDKHQESGTQNILPTSTVVETGSGLTLGHLVRSTMEAMGLSPDIQVAASSSPETLPRKLFWIYPTERVKQEWSPEMLARLGPLRVELSEQCWVQPMTPCEHLRAERISQELKNRNARLATHFWQNMACMLAYGQRCPTGPFD